MLNSQSASQQAPDALEKKLKYLANGLGAVGISQLINACNDWLAQGSTSKTLSLFIATLFLGYGVFNLYRMGKQQAVLQTAKFSTLLLGNEGDFVQLAFLKASLYSLAPLVMTLLLVKTFAEQIASYWSFSSAIMFAIAIYMISFCASTHYLLREDSGQ